MIIITGATGKLGSQIVQQLLERVPAEQVGVSVRDTELAAPLAARGVRVRHGDFTDPGSLTAAFEGATQVLIVSASITGDEAVAHHSAAIEAARDAGAQRVLYTSHQGASVDSFFAAMRDHAATEGNLAKLGVPFTSLRNGFYASTVPYLLGRTLETGELIAPADGPVSWTTHADLAEAAATILAHEVTLDGITPPLTAPEAHDLESIAGILSELTGRSIRRVVVDDAEWTQSLIGNGVPQDQVRMMLGLYLASRRGEFAATDPALEQLLHRPAQTIQAFFKAVISPQ